MIDEKLVTVATFGSAMEAELARNRLAAEGITVFLGDEDTVGLWNLGNNLGVVKLQVAEVDLHRARHLLSLRPRGVASSTVIPSAARFHALWAGWTCSRCGSQVRPRIASCTTCGTNLDDLEDFREVDVGIEPGPEEVEENTPAMVGDQLASRAWRAAVAGFVLFPLHLYALWLLVRLGLFKGELSSRGMRTLYAALGVEASALCLAILLFRLAFLSR